MHFKVRIEQVDGESPGAEFGPSLEAELDGALVLLDPPAREDRLDFDRPSFLALTGWIRWLRQVEPEVLAAVWGPDVGSNGAPNGR